jgi:hypothetical protein
MRHAVRFVRPVLQRHSPSARRHANPDSNANAHGSHDRHHQLHTEGHSAGSMHAGGKLTARRDFLSPSNSSGACMLDSSGGAQRQNAGISDTADRPNPGHGGPGAFGVSSEWVARLYSSGRIAGGSGGGDAGKGEVRASTGRDCASDAVGAGCTCGAPDDASAALWQLRQCFLLRRLLLLACRRCPMAMQQAADTLSDVASDCAYWQRQGTAQSAHGPTFILPELPAWSCQCFRPAGAACVVVPVPGDSHQAAPSTVHGHCRCCRYTWPLTLLDCPSDRSKHCAPFARHLNHAALLQTVAPKGSQRGSLTTCKQHSTRAASTVARCRASRGPVTRKLVPGLRRPLLPQFRCPRFAQVQNATCERAAPVPIGLRRKQTQRTLLCTCCMSLAILASLLSSLASQRRCRLCSRSELCR